jgi:hypothetical protein
MLQCHDDAATYWQRGGSRLRTKLQVISKCNTGTHISVTSAMFSWGDDYLSGYFLTLLHLHSFKCVEWRVVGWKDERCGGGQLCLNPWGCWEIPCDTWCEPRASASYSLFLDISNGPQRSCCLSYALLNRHVFREQFCFDQNPGVSIECVRVYVRPQTLRLN